jgi:hypothetical protein
VRDGELEEGVGVGVKLEVADSVCGVEGVDVDVGEGEGVAERVCVEEGVLVSLGEEAREGVGDGLPVPLCGGVPEPVWLSVAIVDGVIAPLCVVGERV